jgi:nitrate/nitrite-specific signal transduction histidine kinase
MASTKVVITLTYRKLFLVVVLLPPLIIGGFEFIRHDFLLAYMSMETGNLYITLIAFLLSFLFASWVFRMIKRMNARLVEEQARLAVYQERERLARELHDGIAQSLFFLNVKLRQGQLEEARAAVSEIDRHVRQAIFNLRALPEEGNSFNARLEKWLAQWSALTGVEVEHQLDLPDGRFTPAEQVQLFGIVQEAFANIRKHAQARHARILLQPEGKQGWRLVISDDGKGLDQQSGRENKYGMMMMRERAQQLGADFAVRARETGGTELLLVSGKGGIRS